MATPAFTDNVSNIQVFIDPCRSIHGCQDSTISGSEILEILLTSGQIDEENGKYSLG